MTDIDVAHKITAAAEEDFQAAHSRWEQAISARTRFEQKPSLTAVYSDVTSDRYGQLVTTTSPEEDAELARLRVVEEDAWKERHAAGERVVQARIAERQAQFRAAREYSGA